MNKVQALIIKELSEFTIRLKLLTSLPAPVAQGPAAPVPVSMDWALPTLCLLNHIFQHGKQMALLAEKGTSHLALLELA